MNFSMKIDLIKSMVESAEKLDESQKNFLIGYMKGFSDKALNLNKSKKKSK